MVQEEHGSTGLRTDQLWIPGTEIPVSQVLAGTIVVVSFVLIVYNRIKVKKKLLVRQLF